MPIFGKKKSKALEDQARRLSDAVSEDTLAYGRGILEEYLTPASRGIECVFALTDGAFSYQYAEEVSKDVRAHKGGVSEAEWRQLAREPTTRLSFADFHETRARRGIDDGWDLSFVRMESGDEGEDVVKFAIADCFNFASQPVAPQERSALLKSVADRIRLRSRTVIDDKLERGEAVTIKEIVETYQEFEQTPWGMDTYAHARECGSCRS